MERINFNENWRFQKAGSYQWRAVDLPHDAMIHEARHPESAGGAALGYFPGGLYEYEKIFFAPSEWQEKCLTLELEGVYRNCQVYLNGQKAGGRPYGYARFFVPMDPFLKYGAENTLRVTADNSQTPNSRWYTGSGIYRPLHLLVQNRTHIELDGLKVSTLSYAPAKILVETAANGGEIYIEILDGDQVMASGHGAALEFEIENARLWSDQTPHLYHCRASLWENGQVVDEVSVSFGIRKVEWSNQGLFVNGQATKLRGGCIHHDNGILGAATHAKAEERRVRILKEAGFNAIRSAHNPTSIALLEACDRYGMYVMDETWDMWYFHKNQFDYASDFNDWYLEDIKSMVAQDFNHPSVILYSIGNEVAEPYQERGLQLAREMVETLHRLDRNRAVTAGINLFLMDRASKGRGIYKEEGGLAGEGKPSRKKKPQASGSLFFNLIATLVGTQMNKMSNSASADRVTGPCLDALDIAGYNYASGRYRLEARLHPQRVIVGSETFPQDIARNWELVKKYPYVIGDFMWTSWDYLGEAGMGAWSYDGASGFMKPYPYLAAGCGAVDLAGNIGAPARYAAVVWGLEQNPFIGVRPLNHPGVRVSKAVWRGTDAIASWAWKNCNGNKAAIEVYADAHKVELLLNGKSLGKKKLKAFRATFRTRYTPGSLKAIAFDQDGKAISESELTSATGKTCIALKPEETAVQPDEVVFIPIELVGENGIVESNADRQLAVTVEGGTLLGFGSANPCSEERFDGGIYTPYYGRCLAVVRAGDGNQVIVRAVGSGVDAAEAVLAVIG